MTQGHSNAKGVPCPPPLFRHFVKFLRTRASHSASIQAFLFLASFKIVVSPSHFPSSPSCWPTRVRSGKPLLCLPFARRPTGRSGGGCLSFSKGRGRQEGYGFSGNDPCKEERLVNRVRAAFSRLGAQAQGH
jgi:hypothetical protein